MTEQPGDVLADHLPRLPPLKPHVERPARRSPCDCGESVPRSTDCARNPMGDVRLGELAGVFQQSATHRKSAG